MTPEELAAKNGEELVTLARAQKLLKEFSEEPAKVFFSVTFIKRTPPYELRTIARAQFGVKKHLKGGDRAYTPTDYDLLCVYDQDAIDKKTGLKTGGYRSINLDQIVCFKLHGKGYRVKTGG